MRSLASDDGLGPVHWPALLPEEAAVMWPDLRAFVELLVDRFGLDARTVPPCWYRHNRMVETLSALRDHERACFANQNSAAAAMDWFRALRETEARLIEWTARTGCTAGEHRGDPVRSWRTDDAGWRAFVDADVECRDQVLIDAAVRAGAPA